MTSPIFALAKREWRLALRNNADIIQPMIFLLLVVSIFPLGIGAVPELLQKVGGGIIWVAALLASLLGLERLFKDDYVDGNLEQLLLSPNSLPLLILIKTLMHWLVTIVPLIIISPLLALFLNLTVSMYWALLATLLLGTPLLSLVGSIAVALTVGLNRSGVLLALLLLPVFVPLLIFASAAVANAAVALPYMGQLAMLAALSLLALVTAPFAAAYAIRVSLN